jgi:AcrR family transcriptional regulator
MAIDREQRRAQILKVASQVFAEKGYHDARIDDIVLRASIARGTFYLYFQDKRGIFEQILDTFLASLHDTIHVIELEDPNVNPAQQLRDNLRRVMALFVAEPELAQILLSAAVGLDADFDRKLLAFYDAVTELIDRALTQGQAAGLVRTGDTRIRAFCVLGSIKELLLQIVLRKSNEHSDDVVDVLLDFVSTGLFTEHGARALRISPSE